MISEAALKLIHATAMIACFAAALAAPDIFAKVEWASTVGYLAAIGFLFFAIRLLLIAYRKNNKPGNVPAVERK